MKITTLYSTIVKPGKFFTTAEKARKGLLLAPTLPHPAIELDNGTFRLINSDAIVAADREVTLYEARHGFPELVSEFFLSPEAARQHVINCSSFVGGVFPVKAIPLPDGYYRRVREGDVVRLWEPEKTMPGKCGNYASAPEYPKPATAEEFQAAHDRLAESFREARTSQAAPESVEKPISVEEVRDALKHGRAVHVAAQVHTILSLPAGPARAEAKLKLIGEISKL